MANKWGRGLPKNYTKEDIMTPDEMVEFGMRVLKQVELDPNGYKIISMSASANTIPNYVVEKDGQQSYIIVDTVVAPFIAELKDEKREAAIEQAREAGAKCYFAPVTIGSADPARFQYSMALRYDQFYANYEGMEEVL